MKTAPNMHTGLIASLYLNTLTTYPTITLTKPNIVRTPVFLVMVVAPINVICPIVITAPPAIIPVKKVVSSTGFYT